MKKRFSFAIIFFIVGIILAVFISTKAVSEAYRSKKIETEVEALRQQAQKIQEENKALTEKNSYLDSSQFIERVSKEKMNMQKPGENVVVVKPSVSQQVQAIGEKNENVAMQEEKPNYIKWWNFFFKYE